MRAGLPLRFAALIAALMTGAVGLGMAQPGAGWDNLAGQSMGLAVGQLPARLAWMELPVLLDIARLACPIALLWVCIGLVRAAFGNRIALARMRARGEHIVVTGEGGLGKTLVMSELARRKPVVVVGRRGDAIWIDQALRKGAAICADFDRSGLESARALAIVGPDGGANLSLSLAVLASLDAARPPGNPLEIVATVDEDAVVETGSARETDFSTPAGRVRPALLPAMVARQLFRDHHLDAFTWADQLEMTVIVIGFSAVTRLYLVRQLTAGHRRGGRRVRLVVIDRDPASARVELGKRHGAVDTLSPVIFMAWDGTAARLAQIVAGATTGSGYPVAYVIDAGDDAFQLELADAIRQTYASADLPLPPIHARLESVAPEDIPVGVHPFGNRAVMEEPDALTQECHDEIARAIHEFYIEGRLGDGESIGSRESLREWEDLPERYRADNRMVADCHHLKLRDVGARIVAGKTGRATLFRLRPDELEELARAEHDRWMVAKLADGWQHGPVRDDMARLHPDIVPYDRLSEAIKDLDREQVHVITRIVARQGGEVMRLLEIGAIGLGDDLPPLASLRTALATHYPDRLPRFSLVEGCPSVLHTLIGDGALVRMFVSRFGMLPSGIDAVVAVARGSERQTLCESMDLCLLGESEPAFVSRPVIRLDRKGAIVEAPWLR